MATYTKFNCFAYHMGLGYHNLDTHVIKVYLTNAAPDAQNDVWKADLAEITNEGNYANAALDCNWTQSNNISTLASNNDQVWTSNNAFGPFRYVVLFNDNATDGNNVDGLICYWDYASSINCNNGESFTVDFPANKMICSLT